MPIRVEFYGVARRVVGRASLDVEAVSVTTALQQIVQACPAFEENCLRDGRLSANFLASINGERFTRDGDELLRDGDALLIVSADAGG